jgi:hypothetical protein
VIFTFPRAASKNLLELFTHSMTSFVPIGFGSSKWIAEEPENKLCDPESLLRPGFYAHPGLGLLKEPVLEAQAVFQLPQSASPPGAKNAEIVRALFEESGQPAHHPDAVTADLLAYVKRTQARGHGDDRLSGL